MSLDYAIDVVEFVAYCVFMWAGSKDNGRWLWPKLVRGLHISWVFLGAFFAALASNAAAGQYRNGDDDDDDELPLMVNPSTGYAMTSVGLDAGGCALGESDDLFGDD